jgi:ABC-2 type transport system ATP-binding protein
MSARPAVLVDGVSKTFQIPREQVHTLKERALHPFRRAGHDDLRALRDVSFAVERGEFFGIVGRNGSGKSTLLKCLAGIYRTDRGQIYVDGRMSTFIELGVGFNMDLAAYDNVMLNATMLGLSQRETRARYDRIIDFAELREFADLKLKNYSSGMLVRLAFSVMIQVDADILLIDEVLAVGDAAFQQKCYDEFARIRRSGTTVLFVTHDMSAVQRFCDRAVLLEHGRPVELGEPERVGDRYLELNFSRDARDAEAREAGDEAARAPSARQSAEGEPVRLGDGRAEIVEAWFEDEQGERAEVLRAR